MSVLLPAAVLVSCVKRDAAAADKAIADFDEAIQLDPKEALYY